MTSKQNAKLNMYQAVISLCDGQLALIATILLLDSAYTAFKSTVSAILVAAALLEQQTGGLVISKANSKKNMATMGTDIAGMVAAYASSVNDADLEEQMNISYSDIYDKNPASALVVCQNIYTTASNLLPSLSGTGLTAAMLSTFQSAMNDFQSKSPLPKQSRSLKKGTRQQMNTMFDDADKYLKNQMDRLMVNFKTVNLEFVLAYYAARVIDDPGSYHTLLKLVTLHSITGEPIRNVRSYIDDSLLAKRSTTNGSIQYKDPDEGSRRILLKHKNFKEVVIGAIPVSHGDKITRIVLMEPVVYNPENEEPDNPVLLEMVVQIPAGSTVNVPYSFTMHDHYIIMVVNPATSAIVSVGFGPDENSLVNPQEVDRGMTFSETALNLAFSAANQKLNFRNDTTDDAVVVLTVKKL